ncbi:chromatin assembly factor 1 subunit A [Clinocottus analis]|uniref:chromatin assembly factor 1 subunit A n=1 Tax=Clinocottus analis TaxID=304258 RepID=UPI0035C05C87
MLAAENPPVDGHLAASTPRRRGMDRKSSNNVSKKFIQARLPFKRMNTEPKDNQPPKRSCAHACPKPGVPDRENESESSPLPVHSGAPLVNGRGPLDGFLSRRRPEPSDKNTVIDLTSDNTMSPAKRDVSPAVASPCLQAKDKHHGKDKTASSVKTGSVDHTPTTHIIDCTVDNDNEEEEEDEDEQEVEEEDDANQTATNSQLDSTQNSESEPEEQEESGNVSSLGNQSILSTSSVGSTPESSPEESKTDDRTPTSTPKQPKTTPKIPLDQKNIKRRSLKNEQEEKLRLRQEKDRQREEAKAEKLKQKEEARKLKDEQEKEKREKREKEKREKKEKEDKEKADKLKAKEDLRKSKLEAKLEEKRKKEEEKQMKEEEKRLKEEKDRLKATKAGITRFLQKSKIQQAPKTLAAACGKFAPFEIKEHMALAPLCRVQCEDAVLEELDRCLLNPADDLDGLKDWIGSKPRRSGPTNPRQRDSLCECITAEGPEPDGVPDRKQCGPMKLLQFHANYRPAYWGTWSKKSSHISARCPLKQDKDLFDYEVDSDEEWEEEEPGESLSHSEGEDEEEAGEGGEDDSDDDGFFVPHGYLSDDEGAPEEEVGGDLEKQKLRQKVKAKEWDELMSTKKRMKVLDPVVRGCVWEGEGPVLQLFQLYALCLIEPLPKADNSPSPEAFLQKRQREAQLLGQLLPLLHGNVNSSKVIITEFQEFCRQQASSSSSSSSPPELSSPQSPAENVPTRIEVKRLIKSNAVYEKRSTHRRCCWYAHTEVLSRCGQEALPVPCQWTYLTAGAREESREEPQAATGSQGNSPTTPQTSSSTSSTSSSSSKRKSTGSMSITKFMKKCTDPEQTEAMEADGFQADTEEDDEEDCVIIATQSASTTKPSSSSGEADCLMEVTPSDTAALPVASAAPTLATT